MYARRSLFCAAMGVTLIGAAPALAQRPPLAQQPPHLAYLYPAGGQQGVTLQVTAGGQYLTGAKGVHVSGAGLQVRVGKYHRPMTVGEAARLRNKMDETRKEMQGDKPDGAAPGQGGFGGPGAFRKVAKAAGITEEQMDQMADLRRRMNDPKRKLNPAVDETVVLQVTIAADARPGERELRLVTETGLSNPLTFQVGSLPELTETEPNDKIPDSIVRAGLPLVINGQILPGDVDRFAFEMRKGTRLVAAASARELIPYLADAVPGWFQAALTLFDPQGEQVAFAEGTDSQLDPLLHYEAPEDGRYVLQVRDSIYRGREDFVYRLRLGEVPMVTSIFPLGTAQGAAVELELRGWNLPERRLALDARDRSPGLHWISLLLGPQTAYRVPFAVDTLPERREQDANRDGRRAEAISLPVVVNGRIDRPGQWDVYRFEGQAGQEIVAEVWARRLNSPLDAVLRLTDGEGKHLGINDDHEDLGAGLTTHQADSRLCFTLPSAGTYHLHLGDAQQAGGADYAYRLRVAPPRPDFELRVVPASLTARPGTSVPISVLALRKDGFAGEIGLRLKQAPSGFGLSGGRVPAGQDRVRLTLTVPYSMQTEPLAMQLEGYATIAGQEVRRTAVPAEDLMQAFIYHHLVPADEWLLHLVGGGYYRPTVKLLGTGPVRLTPGGTTEVRFALPSLPPGVKLHLQLNEPPEGLTIGQTRITLNEAVIVLRAEAGKVPAGLEGNLILDALVERTAGPEADPPRANRQPFKVGTLPAVPFEITDRN